jgi:uncharacterized coiled-coil protein SlyX
MPGSSLKRTCLLRLNLKRQGSLAKQVGRFPTSIHRASAMVEQLVPALIALVSGGFILTSKINTSIKELDRRIDGVELRVAESYVSKDTFNVIIERFETHLARMEDKIDRLNSTRFDS